MEKFEKVKNLFLEEKNKINSEEFLKDFKIKFLSKNGLINSLLKDIKDFSIEQKKTVGLKINEFKNFVENEIHNIEKEYETNKIKDSLKKDELDVTLQERESNIGLIHPIVKVKNELEKIFQELGFDVENGPEIEDDWFNFEALNTPKNHPARQMQDTFYINNTKYLLRTQTTAVTARGIAKKKIPCKFISLGKVFRRDYDATHLPMFQQIDGVYLDKNITMANLKSVLIDVFKVFFNINEVPLRFRPSYFPFTSPSIEVDIKCTKEYGKIIKFGEGNDWCEILGGGMLHPEVIKNANIDSNEYQGFAFGMGIERLAMLKYGIADMRYLYEGDVRFLKHYSFNFYE